MYPYILSIYYLGIDHTITTRHASYGEAVTEWIELVLLWEWPGEEGRYTDQNNEAITIRVDYKQQQPIRW